MDECCCESRPISDWKVLVSMSIHGIGPFPGSLPGCKMYLTVVERLTAGTEWREFTTNYNRFGDTGFPESTDFIYSTTVEAFQAALDAVSGGTFISEEVVYTGDNLKVTTLNYTTGSRATSITLSRPNTLVDVETLLQALLDSQPDFGSGSVGFHYAPDTGAIVPGQEAGALGQHFNGGESVNGISGLFVVQRWKSTRIIQGTNYCRYTRLRVSAGGGQFSDTQVDCALINNTAIFAPFTPPPPIGATPCPSIGGYTWLDTVLLKPGELLITPRPACCGP